MIKFVNVTESCHRWKLYSVDFKYVVPYSAITIIYLLAASLRLFLICFILIKYILMDIHN